MADSEQEIHKIDLSGNSTSVSGQMDVLLSELQEQLKTIAFAKEADERNLRISMTLEYVRGYRDGNRFAKPKPVSVG